MADSKPEGPGHQTSLENRRSMSATFKALASQWAVFYEISLSPSVLLLVLAGAGLVYIAEFGNTETSLPVAVRVSVTLIVSVLASVIGALVWKRWNDSAEAGVLVTRGKSAVRGLRLLLQSIAAAEARVLRLRPSPVDDPFHSERFLLICDEVLDRLNLLQEETMNAIEEWTDIIPDANIKTQIGVLTTLKKRAGELERQVSSLADEAKQSDHDREELSAELSLKEAELDKVREELTKREDAISTSVLSGLTRSPMFELISDFSRDYGEIYLDSEVSAVYSVCPACRKQFEPKELRDRSDCPNCGKRFDTPSYAVGYISRRVSRQKPPMRVVSPREDVKDDDQASRNPEDEAV